jgi:putative hydrolase of the HAD superfamily
LAHQTQTNSLPYQEEKRNLSVAHLRLSEVAAIFFDFGETLATLAPAKEQLFIRAAQSIGLQLELEAVRRAYQIVDFHNKYSSVEVTDRSAFYQHYNEQLSEALGVSSHFAELAPALAEQFSHAKKWELFAEVPEVLNHLQQAGLRLGLVANWDRDLPELVERLQISQFFSTIVSSQEAGVEKPDAEIFKRALVNLSLVVENATILYVGNEYRADVMGARGAGLVPVLIDRNGLYPHADCLRFASLREWQEAQT